MIIYRETPDGPKFLLTYHGGRSWSFPKGKLDGESNFKAALREVEEETGIAEGDLRFKHHFKVRDRFVFTRDRQHIFKTITYYLAETKRVAITLPVRGENEPGEPHEGYGWFLYRDAFRTLMAPNLKRNLKHAYELVGPAPLAPSPSRSGRERSGLSHGGHNAPKAAHGGRGVPQLRPHHRYHPPPVRTAGPERR